MPMFNFPSPSLCYEPVNGFSDVETGFGEGVVEGAHPGFPCIIIAKSACILQQSTSHWQLLHCEPSELSVCQVCHLQP